MFRDREPCTDRVEKQVFSLDLYPQVGVPFFDGRLLIVGAMVAFVVVHFGILWFNGQSPQ